MSSHPTTISTACQSAAAAFQSLSTLPPTSRADILDAIATALDARRAEILTTTAEETALTIEELTPEFARMTGTLRMFATLIREGSWVRASIDTRIYEPFAQAKVGSPSAPSSPQTSARAKGSYQPLIGPNHDLRKLLIPLGPVAVFGSSNFPLAYGVCGGDTASALAAGCPVIIKEHPAHPVTGRLLAAIAQEAISRVYEPFAQAKAGASSALLQYTHNEDPKDFTVAKQLVQHPAIAAIGFTGSIPGGLAIDKLARERETPIPVFAEMGSLNAVVISSLAMFRRGADIANVIADSILARAGQQCTKPGIIFVPTAMDEDDTGYDDETWEFLRLFYERMKAAPQRPLLAPWITQSYERRIQECIETGSAGIVRSTRPEPGAPCVLVTDARGFRHRPKLREEIFGPATLVVDLFENGFGHGEHDLDEMLELVPGSLTLTVFDEPDGSCIDLLRSSRAGRLIFNGPPTGVRVATSTVHGGPFPATNAPHTTAVGPLAIERWCRPICYQNCPDNLLPPELQNANPRGLWRTINGELTRSPVPN